MDFHKALATLTAVRAGKRVSEQDLIDAVCSTRGGFSAYTPKRPRKQAGEWEAKVPKPPKYAFCHPDPWVERVRQAMFASGERLFTWEITERFGEPQAGKTPGLARIRNAKVGGWFDAERLYFPGVGLRHRYWPVERLRDRPMGPANRALNTVVCSLLDLAKK